MVTICVNLTNERKAQVLKKKHVCRQFTYKFMIYIFLVFRCGCNDEVVRFLLI